VLSHTHRTLLCDLTHTEHYCVISHTQNTTVLSHTHRTLLCYLTRTEHYYVISHSQNTTALQQTVVLTEIHLSLVTYEGRSPFPSAEYLPRSTANSAVIIFTRLLPAHACLPGLDGDHFTVMRVGQTVISLVTVTTCLPYGRNM
jgi:hypothetical protein